MILRWMVAALCGLAVMSTEAQDCQEGWTDEFVHASIGPQVRVLATADLGTGPSLYAGGALSQASGFDVNGITRWNGRFWEPLGDGLSDDEYGLTPIAYAMTSFDDGSGPALFVGGRFFGAGGVAAKHVAKWNGSEWSALGEGAPKTVRALVVHDDGNGPALYRGGLPSDPGYSIVARWDGNEWQEISPAVDSPTERGIRSLASFDDGSGPALYAAGRFTSIFGDGYRVDALSIARWRNGAWEEVGGGFSGGQFRPEPLVAALRVFDDGSGARLYAGGDFTSAGGSPARLAACWDGNTWKEVGGGISEKTYVSSLAAFEDGGEQRLYATANIQVDVGSLFRLDDDGWHSVGDASYGPMFAIAPSGDQLFVGGSMYDIGGVAAGTVAMWDGEAWTGTVPPMGRVSAAELFDDGSGPALFASSVDCNYCIDGYVRRWNGKQWLSAGEPSPKMVQDFQIFDDGSGPALYAAGYWAEGEDVYPCARWTGSEWEPVGDATGFFGVALGVFDRGLGPELYLSRGYTDEGFDSGVLRLENGAWFPMPGSPSKLYSPNCLISFDDGTAAALYAGMWGNDGSLGPIAKWNGQYWSNVPLPKGINKYSRIDAFCAFDDGSGPALFIGGQTQGGVAIVAKWDGSQWWTLGDGLQKSGVSVRALAVGVFGGAERLVVGGLFEAAGDLECSNVALWDGQQWAALGSGTRGVVSEVVPMGENDVFVAGEISQAGGIPANSVAHWLGCPIPCPADCDQSNSLDLLDYLCFSALFDSADPAADCDGSGALDLFDFLCFVNAFEIGC